MMGPEFASCWLKIGRAEEHFNTFKSELSEWNGTHPYTVSSKCNFDGSRHHIVADIKNLPRIDRWSLIAGDCVQNLRSALDHLVYALAIQHSGNPPPTQRTLQFPIFECPDEFKARHKIKALSTKAQAFIERAQPYNRRHQRHPCILSILNEFNNSDKHRLLNVALTHAAGGNIQFTTPLLGVVPEIYWLRTAVVSGADVAFFTLDPPQPDVKYEVKVSFCITVSHFPHPTSGRHVSSLDDVLNASIAEVKRIVNGAI